MLNRFIVDQMKNWKRKKNNKKSRFLQPDLMISILFNVATSFSVHCFARQTITAIIVKLNWTYMILLRLIFALNTISISFLANAIHPLIRSMCSIVDFINQTKMNWANPIVLVHPFLRKHCHWHGQFLFLKMRLNFSGKMTHRWTQ